MIAYQVTPPLHQIHTPEELQALAEQLIGCPVDVDGDLQGVCTSVTITEVGEVVVNCDPKVRRGKAGKARIALAAQEATP